VRRECGAFANYVCINDRAAKSEHGRGVLTRLKLWRFWATRDGPTTSNTAETPWLAPQPAPFCLSQTYEIRLLLIVFPDLSRRYGRPKRSLREGERRPLRMEIGTQRDVCVGPCGGVAPPRLSASLLES